jgi:hypothetical protein
VGYDLGDTVRLLGPCTDPAGAPVNATGAALTITLPDDSTVTPTITNPPTQTGQYLYDYVTSQAGRHTARWVWTTPACAYVDVFDVRPAAAPLIVSLAAAKEQLNIPAATITFDEELRGYIAATTRAVESVVGPVIKRTVSEVRPGGHLLVLNSTPVLALSTLVGIYNSGISYLPADLDTDLVTGIVRRRDGGWFIGPLRVVYTAGRVVIPENFLLAAKIIIQHLWETQRGSGSAATNVDQADVAYLYKAGFAIPRRALELLSPDAEDGIA